MANLHSRSKSFPSQSHPAMECVEDLLCRIKSSEATSTSATSLCANLASLRDLHEDINDMIRMPSIQQALSHESGESWINELIEGSLRLVDLCAFSRDVVCLTKESAQNLGSSIRRNKVETSIAVDVNAYMASRKKISKMAKRCIKNLKSPAALPNKDHYDLKAIATMLKETEALDLSILKSALIALSGENERSNQRSWSLLSKLTQTSRVHSEGEQEDLCFLNISKSQKSMDKTALLKQLKTSEMIIQELEVGLEALFRSLVKTRVSLLNVLN